MKYFVSVRETTNIYHYVCDLRQPKMTGQVSPQMVANDAAWGKLMSIMQTPGMEDMNLNMAANTETLVSMLTKAFSANNQNPVIIVIS